jgi:hypothetical protein
MIRYPELQDVASGSNETAATLASLASLLSVSLANLDSEAEMRKFFGARVIQANKSGTSGSARRQTAQRSNLTRPPASWFQTAAREGLSLRALSDEELDDKLAHHAWDPARDEKWLTVEYTKKYKSVTLAFMKIVYSGGACFFMCVNLIPTFTQTQTAFMACYKNSHGMGIRFFSWRRCSDTEKVARHAIFFHAN